MAQTQPGPVRVRFAPSPTGSLHIGGARTAYFNWLFARQHQGVFVLRIDDTDLARSTEESYRQILDGFRWLGIDWDEGPDVGGPYGPYRQSQRLDIYRAQLQQLVEAGKAYPCFCTPEQLAADRERAQAAGQAPRYSGRCRDLTREEVERRLAAGERPAYRLRAPQEGTTVVHDLIRGDVAFDNAEIDDFVIWKSDGMPTYHFASCVDDYLMGITHIIRAEEHLSNTPRHIQLFHALGAPIPAFAHVPMILAPDRSKLSKRHGATSVQEYREQGILPEALINYLLLLGFSPGEDREVISRDEAVAVFDLEKVTKHAAVYDVKKLEWLNAHYLRAMPAERALSLIWETLRKRGWVGADPGRETLAWLLNLVRAVQERSRSVGELAASMAYYFEAPAAYDEKGVRKHFTTAAADRLLEAADALDSATPFTAANVEAVYRSLIAAWGIKGGELIHPTRLALTGVTVGPGLFDVMALLGRAECQTRMRAAAAWIRRSV
ncbi:MAG: glutamate--tRNA ligase [Alicyclobacillus macrosporangiidus]|uniref:glutamate--tRNA ligase n=1 Tax=Alicyclobacillus macrosporangiidus TaxID=392015 RepID=UPI0026EB8399|nr:glutamate--tRNA ligase [Alicyclobacillus macrosporangiidus]MCL6597894.1 glutamate--tRNA ligase [Alicyclobacillus macrosporangiidus]